MNTTVHPAMNPNEFVINGSILAWIRLEPPFTVSSFPRPYSVRIVKTPDEYNSLVSAADFVVIDANIARLYGTADQDSDNVFAVIPSEENKTLDTASVIIDRMIDLGISKGSNVLAIGGGIVQDLSACACALFRRGQPFTYVPTTTLGQLDSCVGAKCAVNTVKAKNILGLFSAPKEVVIPTFMIQSMPPSDHRAGLAEMLRLCLTASMDAVETYRELLPAIADPESMDLSAYAEAVSVSLSIKKSVVDFDEYERDIRRSMNYGHTFGHAIEKLSNFQIPHGLGVLLGMHIANTYATAIGIMSATCLETLTPIFKQTAQGIRLPKSIIEKLRPEDIISQFRYDKKGDGSSVPLILIQQPGFMIFHKYLFLQSHEVLAESLQSGIDEFFSWTIQA
jgi:3-dehydroquinate synthase